MADPNISTTSDHHPAIDTLKVDMDMQPVVDSSTSQVKTITIETINIPTAVPVQNLQGNTINVAIPDSSSSVLPTDYMNILDIVLDNSKLNLQGGLAENQAIVLAEVDGASGDMVAVSQSSDGNTIALTADQVSALTAAAAQEGNVVSIINPDQSSIPVTDGNMQENAILATMADLKGRLNVGTKDIIMKDDNGDDIEFEDDIIEEEFEDNLDSPELQCQSCPKIFPNKESCVSHMLEVHGTDYNELAIKSESGRSGGSFKGEMKYKCDECGRPYVTKAALKKHLQLVHGKEMDSPLQKATSKCIHPGCEKVFYHRQKMIDHLRETHGVNCVQEDLVFNSWEEFLMWKEKEEDANFVHFSKNSTHTNAKNYMLTNFTCQREGKAGYKYKGSQQKKYKDLVIGEKICPARMRARLDKPTGRVTVQYCKSHNHKLSFQDFLYRRMPDRLRNEIREKLSAGMSSEEVYKELKSTDNLRENRGERFAPSKRQFVTLVNIKTIAKRMQIKEAGPSKSVALEPEPVAIQMQKLLDETYNPVLLYKDQGANVEVGPEEIDQVTGAHDLMLIGLQTKEQRDMFVKHGEKIVFIDITEGVITPSQYVISVKVLDEYNKGYPVGFLISNSRDETVLFYFFREMHNRIVEAGLKVSAVMTENSCNEYYAFRSVFGEDVKHLLCKWNLHRAWCQKIHEECAGDEALQQELYFIFVTMLEEQDMTKFESIATEFVNNYQTRCANFITFFMSNYLSQPEVWASCYRNIPHSDCDEILYGDRIHDRIKKEVKNNHKVKSVDDILDLILKFEHEDYFNRGLNLMLNPPEPAIMISEHALGMKIKNTHVIENYSADNRWLVKTSKKDPADLQSMKEETFIVTWKADICEKDFCRERCLKLACFGLCGHLYHCSCDGEPVTPCCHIHKVHSMRIGVSQYQNEDDATKAEVKDAVEGIFADDVASGLLDATQVSGTTVPVNSTDQTPKLNLVNQVHTTTAPDPDRAKDQKIKKIKMNLVKLYKFLESENIQKYSLDFIEAGLKKVIDECKVIDSIGQSKTVESFRGKRKSPEKDLEDFELMIKSCKKRKVMGMSVPVIVEIEPDASLYNTFRKRITNSTEETPEDRMLRLSKSKNITINIESDEKFRKTQSQQVTSTPGIIIAKEGEESLKVDGEVVEPEQPNEADTEWTPRGPRKTKGKGKLPTKRRATKTSMKAANITIPALNVIDDPLKDIIHNGNHILSMAHLKSLDIDLTEEESSSLATLIPGYTSGFVSDLVINSYLYTVSKKYNVLYLSIEEMQSLCASQPHTERFWDVDEIAGVKRLKYIFVPWHNSEKVFGLFVVDLQTESMMYIDPVNRYEEIPQNLKTVHATLIGLMATEIPFDSTRASQPTWPLSTPERTGSVDAKDNVVQLLWYVNQLAQKLSIKDSHASMDNFRKLVYEDLTGFCMDHVIENKLTICAVCKLEEGTSVECNRCNQVYHIACLKDDVNDGSFVCTC